MAKKTRIRLSDRQVDQAPEDLLNLKGHTNIAEEGIFSIYNIPIDVKNITPGQVLTYDGEKISGKENDASAGKLGPAPDPDGLYGEPDGNGPGVEEGDSVESAIDKIIDFLDLTAPPKPQDLSQKTFTVPNLFSARREGTLSNVTNITYETSPVIIVTGSDDGLFYDGKSGELTATVYDGNADRTETITKELTNDDDTGNYGSGGILLKITADISFNTIWKGLKARVQSPFNLEAGPLAHTYTISHSKSGSKQVNFFVDEHKTPVVDENSVSVDSAATTKYISGVPTWNTGSLLECNFVVKNAITNFYNNVRVARIESTAISSGVNVPLAIYDKDSDVSISNKVAIANNKFIENISLTYRGYNARGTESNDIASLTQNSNIRVDTVSNESKRVSSGSGQYPSIGETIDSNSDAAGGAYISEESLLENEELQLENNIFKYPTKNYSLFNPAGPNYSSANGKRWVTVNAGNISTASNLTFEIRDAKNMTFDAVSKTINVPGVELQIRVEGPDGTNGWLDVNSAYNAGDPMNNGDACLNVGAGGTTTTGTHIGRVVTFGTNDKTGTVFIRLGLPQGSNITLTNIVIV